MVTARAATLGWMPDCRACAWHDGTLAVEWRREARKLVAENYQAYIGKLQMLAYFQAMIDQLGVNNAKADSAEVAPGIVVISRGRGHWFGRILGR